MLHNEPFKDLLLRQVFCIAAVEGRRKVSEMKVSDEKWLAAQEELSFDQQNELLRPDTGPALRSWLDDRITARKAALQLATDRQSAAVLATAGTLEGYDG